MLATKDGSIQADVNISSGDKNVRMAVVVAESKDGSVKLSVVSLGLNYLMEIQN